MSLFFTITLGGSAYFPRFVGREQPQPGGTKFAVCEQRRQDVNPRVLFHIYVLLHTQTGNSHRALLNPAPGPGVLRCYWLWSVR